MNILQEVRQGHIHYCPGGVFYVAVVRSGGVSEATEGSKAEHFNVLPFFEGFAAEW